MFNALRGIRVCPFCGEEVRAIAVLCKHCHSTLTPLDQAQTKAEADGPGAEARTTTEAVPAARVEKALWGGAALIIAGVVGLGVFAVSRGAGRDLRGEFAQVQRGKTSLLGRETEFAREYRLTVGERSIEWKVTDLETGALYVDCSGTYEPPGEVRNVVLRVYMTCTGSGDFWEPHNKQLVYSASDDTWTVNSRYLLRDIAVRLVRD